MPTLPKSLITLGAGLLTARTAARLRRREAGTAAQTRTLRGLLRRLAATQQGRADGLEPALTGAQFAARVPPRTYEQFIPAIERMKRGEANVLCPGRCPLFATSAGTSAAYLKQLPVTEGMLRHFRRAGLAALLHYTARVGHAGVFRGRHLFLDATTTLNPLPESGGAAAYAGELGSVVTLNLPRWAVRHYYEPGAAIAGIADWSAKVAAIAEHAAGRDISLLGGVPGWLLLLADAVRHQGAGAGPAGNLRAVWPNLECVIHGGQAMGPYADALHAACGPGVNFHEVYAAAEGFIAAQDAGPGQGLRLFTDAGLYFEFLPLADYDESRLAQLGPKAVPLEGMQAGTDYVLLLTTPAGLTRYVLGDVVRFTSTRPPRLVVVGGTRLQLNAFGEQVLEADLNEALLGVCREQGWIIVNFHVAPRGVASLTGQSRGRHEWWIELRPGTVTTPTGPLLEQQLDARLQQGSSRYAALRRSGSLLAPAVRLVMPGTFEDWQRQRRRWGGLNKVPRCRSDREVADELALITRFRPETSVPWEKPAGRT